LRIKNTFLWVSGVGLLSWTDGWVRTVRRTLPIKDMESSYIHIHGRRM